MEMIFGYQMTLQTPTENDSHKKQRIRIKGKKQWQGYIGTQNINH